MYSIVLSIPVVGSYLASFLFGGNFPGNGLIIPRLFILHVLIIPLVLLGLIAGHLGLLVKQKHTQFPGHGRTEDNVVGTPMYPTFILKTTGFLFMVAGVLWALGALVQINPIWQFGPYEPTVISYAVQPDWYMGWLDGALRIMPSWEFTGFGHTIPFEVFLPAVIFPGIIFTLCFGWPAIERIFTKDTAMHNLLDRPRDRPKRTAAGAAMIGLLFTCFGASATDVLANFFNVSLNAVLWSFRILVFVVPIVAGFVTWKICLELQHGGEGLGQRKRAMVVSRTAAGEYVAVPAAPRPGDEHHELEAVPVPTLIDLDDGSLEVTGGNTRPDADGVRRVIR
jgi:ubiquinol-cytochrome c reductase cytochrome b subunit